VQTLNHDGDKPRFSYQFINGAFVNVPLPQDKITDALKGASTRHAQSAWLDAQAAFDAHDARRIEFAPVADQHLAIAERIASGRIERRELPDAA
jgi:hypothetical protein